MTEEAKIAALLRAAGYRVTVATAEAMTDHELLLAIHALLDGKDWTSDTLGEIAALLDAAGYPIRDVNDEERPE